MVCGFGERGIVDTSCQKMIFICKVVGITFRERIERPDMWGELKVEMLLLALKGLC